MTLSSLKKRLSLKELSLIPKSMTAQMVLVILLTLAIAQALTALILYDAHKTNIYQSAQGQLISHTTQLARKLSQAQPAFYGSMVEAASSPRARYSISLQSSLDDLDHSDMRNRKARRIEQLLGPDFKNSVRVRISPHHGHTRLSERCVTDPLTAERSCRPMPQKRAPRETNFIAMSIQLPNQSWLNLAAEAPAIEPLAARQTIVFLIIASTLVLLVIIFMVRRITHPLRALSTASNRLGRGEDVEPLTEEGPDDVKRAISAFNRMNQRLKRFVEDRTTMIAAITHDLRTPITTLRLRVELLPDSNEKEKLLATINEMQHMAEATLTFARENTDKEPSRKVNMNALLDSTCEDLMEIGLDVSYTEGADIISICRPLNLRRGLRNLIENAVKYGQRARVSMTRDRQNITITIDDDGPGISKKDQERVFEPFVRLEHSRNKETGGIGLGMAIARNIIHAHGGEITLANRKEGGLCITVILPV